MGLSSRILAHSVQLLQHSSNAPSLKRTVPFGASSSDQTKQKRVDGATLLGSAGVSDGRTSMEADGIEPLLSSINETTPLSLLNETSLSSSINRTMPASSSINEMMLLPSINGTTLSSSLFNKTMLSVPINGTLPSSINETAPSSSINETTQAPSELQPALHHLTSDPGPSASQQRMPITVYLEQIAKEWWGLNVPSIGFNIQDENDGSDEEVDEVDDGDRVDREMEIKDNGYWDEVTVAGTGISASDRLEEHFIHEAMSIGKDSFCKQGTCG